MDDKTIRLIKIIKNAITRYSEENFIYCIPGFMSRSFTAFCSIREDLLLIRKYLIKLQTEKDTLISSALTYSTISLYGKCFTDASGSKSSKLEPNHLFDKSSQLLTTHEYLMNLRHNFIAHRGDSEGEVDAAYLLIPKHEGESQVRYVQTKQMRLNSEMIKNILLLIDYLIEKVTDKINKTAKKTYDAYFGNFTKEQMRFMLLNNLKDED